MKIDACFQLGYLTGTRGLSGELLGSLDTDQPEYYKDLESVFVLPKGGRTLIPFFIQSIKINGEKAIIKFDELSTRDDAREFVGSSIYLPLELLPPLEGNSFYYHELVGWSVRDQKLETLGTISAVNDQSPQVLLIMDYQDREVLIPLNEDIVLGIDRDQQQVQVALPDGLLDVYLDQ
jgi:16S rRNA processing protein RimM